MTAKQETRPLAFFRSDPTQPRKHFREADLLLLAASLKSFGLLQPVGAKADGTLLWGERRVRAAQLAGLKELAVIITDRPMSDSEIRLIQLTENMHREDLSAYEKFVACSELMRLNPEWQLKDLAEHLNIDPSMVTRLVSPSKLIGTWQEALKDGKVGISDCYAASKLDEKEQAGLLALKLSGASRDTIEQASRKARTTTPSVKVNRVKCVLPSGVQIVVSGNGVSLEESIDALNEAIREMKRARELGYTAKTFAAAMKDKAKKS